MVRLIQSRTAACKDCRKQHKISSWLDFTYFGGSVSLKVTRFKHLSIHLFTCLMRFWTFCQGTEFTTALPFKICNTCFHLKCINRMNFSFWRKMESQQAPNSKVLITHSFSTLRVEMPGRLLVFSSGSHRACWLVILSLSSAASSILHSTFVCNSVYLHSRHCKKSRHTVRNR